MPRSRLLAPAALLVGALVLAYWGALRGAFIWDDDLHVHANPTIVGPLGLKEIWTTARANYFPLVLTTFWSVHAWFGLDPLPYHVVTLACHILAALLLWRALGQLRVPAAWLGAALWALHPVQVESVAWISELKNTQSAIFFLAAVSSWLAWLEGRRSGHYLLALLCATAALLSKPSTVMLPVALALCAWWRSPAPERAHLRRLALALLPFLALSALTAGWTIWEQRYHSGAIGPEWSQTWPERGAIAGRAVWFYLGKLLWPEPLIFIYPRWEIRATVLALAPLAALAVVLGLIGWRARRGEPAARALLLAALYFGALLFPVLGFFDVYFFRYAFVGDHFQYLASIGPLALAAAGLARLPRAIFLGASAALLLGAGVLTARHAATFRDLETLWTTTITRHPECRMAWLNLGDTHSRAGRRDEAMAAFRRALEIAPNDAEGHNDLGCELMLVGRPGEALPHHERAVALKPDKAEHHSNLGNALSVLGRHTEAVAAFERALALDPDYADAHVNLGAEFAESGRIAEALPHFESVVRLQPAHTRARENLARALLRLGRAPEAVAHFEAVLRAKPDARGALVGLGAGLAQAGRHAEALEVLQRALALEPESAEVHQNLGVLYRALGRAADAADHLTRAAELGAARPGR